MPTSIHQTGAGGVNKEKPRTDAVKADFDKAKADYSAVVALIEWKKGIWTSFESRTLSPLNSKRHNPTIRLHGSLVVFCAGLLRDLVNRDRAYAGAVAAVRSHTRLELPLVASERLWVRRVVHRLVIVPLKERLTVLVVFRHALRLWNLYIRNLS